MGLRTRRHRQLLFGDITAIVLTMSDVLDVPARIPGMSVRLLVTGLLFAGTGTAVVVSPLGRRSGGHLNPVVTLALRVTGHVHGLDLIGCAVAQLAGTGVRLLTAKLCNDPRYPGVLRSPLPMAMSGHPGAVT